MLDWSRGSWTGSINKWVEREVRESLHENPVARRSRYNTFHRILGRFLSIGTFGRFVASYMAINVAMLLSEVAMPLTVPDWLPNWTPPSTELKTLLLNLSSYLIGAQVGALGVISLALALVTLIAQRENSSTDIKVYYHESFAFEIVASCIALLSVLCAQLIWPTHFLLHRFGLGTDLQAFKFCLLGVHLLWLLFNLAGLAHFIAITFNFVHQSEREEMRERYTANVVQPRDMTERLRQQLYLSASEIIGDGNDDSHPSVSFGSNYGDPQIVEIESHFRRPVALQDVRVIYVGWALRRWAKRCAEAERKQPPASRAFPRQSPLIWFTPQMDALLRGNVGWCHRRGGVQLTRLEKLILRSAFRFRRISDEA